MKANILKISTSLLVLLIGFSSCENSLTEKDKLRKGGEDTDGPIVVGMVMNSGEEPVYPATLELYAVDGYEPLDTGDVDAEGGFHFHLNNTGSYFFRVYQDEDLLGVSDSFEAGDSTYVEIRLDLP